MTRRNSTPAGRGVPYRRRRLEMLIFLAVCVVGVYALGQGLRGVFQPGAGIDLGWLAVAGGAFWVLYGQMCRVQEKWPRRPGGRPRRRAGNRAPSRAGDAEARKP
jgi:hypothetical protein